MKKTLFSLVFSLFSVLLCAFVFSNSEITASAVNDIYVSVEQLTEADSTYTQAGDFKVTVSIANNSGFAHYGFALYYDRNNFSPVTYDDDGIVQPEYDVGSVLSRFASVVVIDVDQGAYGISGGYSSNRSTNGEMISIYLRRNTGSSSMTPVTALVFDQLLNSSREPLSYSVSPGYEVSGVYRIGDTNRDGYLDISDSIYILRTIDNANGITITAYNYVTYFPNATVGSYICSFEAMDINGDGVLTEADSTAIQQYLTGQTSAGVLANYTNTCYVISTTAPAATA